MIKTRQATLTDAAWYELQATVYAKSIIIKENPEGAGWPSSAWRFADTETVGTDYNSVAAGGQHIFYAPVWRPFQINETVVYLRLVSGSAVFDIKESDAKE